MTRKYRPVLAAALLAVSLAGCSRKSTPEILLEAVEETTIAATVTETATQPTAAKITIPETTVPETTVPETTAPEATTSKTAKQNNTSSRNTASPAQTSPAPTAPKASEPTSATASTTHTHSWGSWRVTRAATESSAGAKERDCTVCKKTETESIPKLTHQHSYQEKVTTLPTCTREGKKTFTCACGAQYTQAIEKASHNYKATVVQPTCSEQGYTLHQCVLCGSSYKDSYTACSIHNYETKVTAPTCTEKGYTTYTCKTCSAFKTADFTEATGHAYGEWNTTKEPTETALGTQARKCGVCGAEDTKTLDRLPHTHSYTSSVTKEATCSEEGLAIFRCTCGGYYTISIPKTPHSWTEWVTTLEPSETSEGAAERSCNVCKELETTILEKLPHTHDYQEMRVEPTCEKDGYILRSCACGDSYKEVLAGGHKWQVIQQVWRTREYAKCPHCDVYLCELDGTTDPNDALWAHIEASGGDWYNHSWCNASESILVSDGKYQCSVCGAEKPWN